MHERGAASTTNWFTNMYWDPSIIPNTDHGNDRSVTLSPVHTICCFNDVLVILYIILRQAFGSYASQSQFSETELTGDCSSYPGGEGIDIDGSSSPAPQDSEADEDLSSSEGSEDGTIPLEAGVNYAQEAEDAVSYIYEIETNTAAGSSGQGECATVLKVSKVEVEHATYSDPATEVDNLFDADLDTYYSVNRESTSITLELEDETEVNGVSIGFFMKFASEERIQTFDLAVRKGGDTDWRTVLSRKESSGERGIMQTFPFSSRSARYVRFESHGNS